jgi:hypothetical protein
MKLQVRPTFESVSGQTVNINIPNRHAKFLGESPYYLALNSTELETATQYTENKLKNEEKENVLNQLAQETGQTFANMLAEHRSDMMAAKSAQLHPVDKEYDARRDAEEERMKRMEQMMKEMEERNKVAFYESYQLKKLFSR